MDSSGIRMVINPADAGMAEKIDSEEPSVPSDVRRWSAHEGWVGWEEEWQVGVIRRYFRCWLRFHLPSLAGDARALFRVHLNRGDSNVGALDVVAYRTQGEEWSPSGQRLGSLGAVDRFEPRWLEMDLPVRELLPSQINYLELRAEREETRGYGTRCAAAFDLMDPAPRAEIVLTYAWRAHPNRGSGMASTERKEEGT